MIKEIEEFVEETETLIMSDDFEEFILSSSNVLHPSVLVSAGDRNWEPLVYASVMDLTVPTLEAMKRFQFPLHDKFQKSIDNMLLELSEKGETEGEWCICVYFCLSVFVLVGHSYFNYRVEIIKILSLVDANYFHKNEVHNIFGEWMEGGRNCLHLAARGGRLDTAKFLCERSPGLQLEPDDYGNIPLLVAQQMLAANPTSEKYRATFNFLHNQLSELSPEVVKKKAKRDKDDARRDGPRVEEQKRKLKEEAIKSIIELNKTPTQSPTRVLFVHAKGCSWTSHWYITAAKSIHSATGIPCILPYKPMPHRPEGTMCTSWVNYLLTELNADVHCIIIGHSSGANATLRLAEKVQLKGIILLGAAYTQDDLEGDAAAKVAGVPDGDDARIVPFDIPAILDNMRGGPIVLIHGEDDDVVPVGGARGLAQEFNEVGR